jgi:glycosyltransferase involved in cell wall biosynthesis
MDRLNDSFKAKEIFHFMKREIPRYTLVVQGRFHAFALAKSLIALDMPVRVVTNYPAFLAERFGLPRGHVTGCAPLGLLHRYAYRWNIGQRSDALNRFLHVAFSRWAARQVLKNPPDVLHTFSGVALELYDALDRSGLSPVRLLARGSAHIREQCAELKRESRRSGTKIDMPGTWMIRREMGEYRRSDHIVTLSTYARKSFLTRGYAEEKVMLLPLGSDVKAFRPERPVLEARLQRLKSGKPLTVLGTGLFCLRKGAIDFIETARALQGSMRFQWVGTITEDAASLAGSASKLIEFIPRVSEHELPSFYNEADLYLLPTIEDGFAVTLTQARAACVPIIASDHCAAPDMITNGETGWIVPIRSAGQIVAKLEALNNDREMTAGMVEKLWQECDTRDWSDVGRDFLKLAAAALTSRASVQS